MGALFICLNIFHKQQHQKYSSIIESMQDNQYPLITADVIDHNVHQIYLVYHDISYVFNQYEN